MSANIVHTKAPARLRAPYTTAVADGATANVDTFEMHPNSGLCIMADGDRNFTVRVHDMDPSDDHLFGYTDYPVTSAGTVIFHRGALGAKVELVNSAGGELTPDVRFYPMGQP